MQTQQGNKAKWVWLSGMITTLLRACRQQVSTVLLLHMYTEQLDF